MDIKLCMTGINLANGAFSLTHGKEKRRNVIGERSPLVFLSPTFLPPLKVFF